MPATSILIQRQQLKGDGDNGGGTMGPPRALAITANRINLRQLFYRLQGGRKRSAQLSD